MPLIEFVHEDLSSDPQAILVKVSGAIDMNTVQTFMEELEVPRANGRVRTLLDLSEVKYINSTGLGALVKYVDIYTSEGGGLAIINPSPKVKLTLEMMNLDSVIGMYLNPAEALEGMKNGGPALRDDSAGEVEAPSFVGAEDAPMAPFVQQNAPSAPQFVEEAIAPEIDKSEFQKDMRPYPKTSQCSCGSILKIPTSGRFICPRCRAMHLANKDYSVTITKEEREKPIQLMVGVDKETIKGVKFFVSLAARRIKLSENEIANVQIAIGEVMSKVYSIAYKSNPNSLFNLLVYTDDATLTIETSDHGEDLFADGDAKTVLPKASQVMNQIQHKPHPSGGNVLRLIKKRAGAAKK